MNEEQLKRTLQSVGMKCFIQYYDLFSSKDAYREDIIETLEIENDFTENSCISRTIHAQRVFRENAEKDALKLIISASRVDPETRENAEKIYAKLTLAPINPYSIPLIKKLASLEAADKQCKKVYCTTCGGLSSTIEKNLTRIGSISHLF